MVKHKGKGLGGTEKSKKQKLTPAEETLRASEARPGKEGASPKVQEANSELTPEERRVLERKLKKERKKEEKKRLREAGIAAAQTAKGQTLPAKPSAAVLALEYLQGWAQKQESWRFQKTRQTWLLMNMYDEDKVPDEHFSTLLDYLEGLKGSARELTVQKAEALMQELDEADTETRDTQLGKMERLRQVLQLLSSHGCGSKQVTSSSSALRISFQSPGKGPSPHILLPISSPGALRIEHGLPVTAPRCHSYVPGPEVAVDRFCCSINENLRD
ncbi:uncharacterized protein C7orf50 homolog isoform X2 [Cricetulus griseus]|uniref:Uncharacterized protein C7orf50 homolog isoform X2 n=2 Tax=Cricetulus griseus TaxID=10029 RepID=A0A9J7GX90_CRIGR|nr:uncharacterized protein C7orf50 homolog isoform X2 [Cricetulus griseus]XP_035314745.1 uncharacterized protein C7orf50 homolog isoform X2 [Cricetulus griseus]